MDINIGRRSALTTLATSVLIGVQALFPGINGVRLLKFAFAMGNADIPQGMHKIQGDVRINNIPAQNGDIVSTGDIITTGAASMAMFVCGTSAYMMRENSRLIMDSSDTSETSKEQKAINALRLLDGKLLSVFGSGNKNIETPTAYIGIRGTGIYLEVDNKKTYLCTCYGTVTVSSKSDPEEKVKLTTWHHEAPRYIYKSYPDIPYQKADPVGKTGVSSESTTNSKSNIADLITRAPMKNHTDAELIMLESIAGRIPPFVKNLNNKNDGGGGY